ncbi:hypothetical protein QAD02_020757 [Eretmocerus hayati]|uniref:Uncharacterized protein n=1 Tax=Eretmocerus hayati TaxID=131215 RepID=A0ACC2PQU4_9HYME|nr:hypothetical protein QAD02_020757 [Eretmocerus hayati]
MVDFMSRKGWKILNGSHEGDEEGDITFIGARGSTVIDYVIVNSKMLESVGKFKEEEQIESDHAPISVFIESKQSEMGLENEDSRINSMHGPRKRIFTWIIDDIQNFSK